MYDIQLIKSRVNCVSYAQRVGLPISKPGDRCISPLRTGAKNPTSFVVFEEYYYDYAEGSGGDVIELCAALNHQGNRGAAIRELAQLTGVASDGTENTQEWLDYTNQMNAKTAFYHSQLTDSDRDYLHSRGVKDDDISRLMIGRVTDGPLRGRLFLPYFSGYNGYVCYYATRSMPDGTYPENKYMKQKRDAFCQHLPWGLQTLNRGGDTLVIAEGYFDCIAFEIEGYPVLSAITGRFSKDQLPVVLSVARKFSRVFIVYDNDERTRAGESFARTMADILTRNRIPFVVGTVPTPYHDISEYYAAGGDLSRIIDSAQDGIQYIAGTYKNFEDLERFIYTIARHTKRSRMDSLLAYLKKISDFDPRSLDTLFRAATTAPPENIVADEILKSKQLVYVDGVGFYEYFGGYWHSQPDGVIKSYADRAYGEFSTAQRVTAICNLLKTRALQTVLFDRQPVWNFINGTLELDTGKFREHNPSDYCSFQAQYPYNPDATYHAWEKFIDDITGDDPKTSELLQFIPGYVLMPHTNYEKIFVLTGSGGNGKSKYLEILRQLFGEENCTHITPRGLLDKFQRINLRRSFVNLAGEIKSDVRDAEEYMKMIASGEPLSACYKNQNYVDFISRTKLVYACNGQLASGDTSEGLTRRLIIIDFKMKFVDYPDPADPYQRQKNIHVLDELSEELRSGGIFNWAYDGYKLLQTVGYFTETSDQEELISNFNRASNPVLVFFEGEVLENLYPEIDYKQLYSDYTAWCLDNGYRPETSHKFHGEFKKVSERWYESGTKSIRVDGKPRKQRLYRLRGLR